MKFSTGETISPTNWSSSRQRAKRNNTTTSNEKYALNDFLTRLAEECERIYNTSLKNGIPSPELIRRGLREFIDKNKAEEGSNPNSNSLFGLIEKFTSGEILFEGRKRSPSTIKSYNTTKRHLESFERAKKFPVNFDTIDLTFFDKFNDYLISKNIEQNGRNKYIKTLKVFLHEAVERNLTDNIQFKRKKFNVKRIEPESTYLTTSEILKLYKHDLSDKPSLERVRDLFILGCFIGLRYSDLSTLTQANFSEIEGEAYIKKKTQKTGEQVIIPTNPIVKEILKKYNGRIPPAPSGQKFNEYIKKAAEQAKLNEIGRLSRNPEIPLFNCIASHTARRSFATNLYLQGFPVFDLMKITGHKSERTLLLYIKVTHLQAASRLNDHMKKTWSEKILQKVS